jgi:hypothetical protein
VLVGEPVGHLQQGVGLGAEGADLGADAAAGRELADAGDDDLLVDVETGAAGVEGIHDRDSVERDGRGVATE